MNKISIIVPIYNSEKYLKECIESIIHQSYPNLEIILVDDGSNDHSLEICNEYKNMDSRIIVIHKENGGLPSARNAGLDVVSGDFIMFCDADDFFYPNSCEVLLQVITENNCDFAIGNYIHTDEDGTLWDAPIFDLNKYSDFKLDITDYKKSFYIMSSSVCNKIFRTSFIRNLQLKFRDKLPAEDAIFTTYCYMKSTCVYYTKEIIYHYRQRNHGTSISTNNNLDYFKGISRAYSIIYRNFRTNHQLDYYRYFYLKSLFYMAYKYIDSVVMNDEERVLALKELYPFISLSKRLKIAFEDNEFFQFLQFVCEEKWEDAVLLGKRIAAIRRNLSEEHKLKMSKIPPEDYQKYLSNKELEVYKNVALVVDEPNWAFDIEAKLLKKKFQDIFDIDIYAASEYGNDLYQLLQDVKDYDRIHFFWRKLLLQFTSKEFMDYFHDEQDYSSYVKRVCPKISTGIYDHLFLEENDIHDYTPIFNHYCGKYYTCSRKLERIYQNISSYPSPFGTIHDTYDNELYDGGDRNRFRTRKRDSLVIGWVGNSNWNIKVKDFKGFHSILKPAIEELRAEGLQIEEFYADKNIRFRTNEEMPDYYQNLDVCVIVSTEEGTPRPILEGMASGCPIITTDVGIAEETFGPKQQEYIIGRRNGENDVEIKEALKEKLRYLYHHREELIDLSDENYEYGEFNDIDHLMPLYQIFFEEK